MLNPTDLKLFGFDARTSLGAPTEESWTTGRRKKFLLRPEVARPVSVDRRVWPELPCALKPESEYPEYWSDLGELCRRCSDVEATLVSMTVETGKPAAQPLLIPCEPPTPADEWTRLGYDVADSGLTSAVANCGFLPGLDEVAALRKIWGPRLNDRGLFRSQDDAVAYRDLSDNRVPEHAPFLIMALFEVNDSVATRGS